MTHTRFVVVADDRRARIYRVTTSREGNGRPRGELVERCHCDRDGDACVGYAKTIIDAMLREVKSATAPTVVVTTSPMLHRCLHDRLLEVVRAGAAVCELGFDLTDLSHPELEETLSYAAFV